VLRTSQKFLAEGAAKYRELNDEEVCQKGFGQGLIKEAPICTMLEQQRKPEASRGPNFSLSMTSDRLSERKSRRVVAVKKEQTIERKQLVKVRFGSSRQAKKCGPGSGTHMRSM
jgi:hypothetical protein